MALNRRTVILLILAIAIWGVAIVVLYINYGPKKTSTATAGTTSSQTINEQASQAGNVNMPVTTTPAGQSSTNMPGATSNGPSIVNNLPSWANLSITELASMVQSKISIKNIFEPYFVDLVNLLEGVSESLESQDSSTLIEDITSDSTQYHGYLEIKDGKTRIIRLYLTLNGETKAWLSEELIDGKYKVIHVSSKFLVVLDTLDGRLKKISVMQE